MKGCAQKKQKRFLTRSASFEMLATVGRTEQQLRNHRTSRDAMETRFKARQTEGLSVGASGDLESPCFGRESYQVQI